MSGKSDNIQGSILFNNTPNMNPELPVLLYNKGWHLIYWIGASTDSAFRCNSYLIKNNKEAILIDPGGRDAFAQVKRSIQTIMDPAGITALILSHQDPDIAASMFDWIELNPSIQIISSPRTHLLLPHYGKLEYNSFDNEENNHYSLSEESELYFVPAPFLHFPGAFVTYDKTSNFLFTGDIWSSLDTNWKMFVESFSQHVSQMDLFHKDYMSTGIAARGFIRSLVNLEIEAILPQHGSIIGKDHIQSAFLYLENLECGIDIIYPAGEIADIFFDELDEDDELTELSQIEPEISLETSPGTNGDNLQHETSLLREALVQSRRLAVMRDRALRVLRKTERKLQESEAKLSRNHRLITIIDRLREQFIAQTDPFQMYNGFLKDLVDLTESEFGFLGEIGVEGESTPYLKIFGISEIEGTEGLNHMKEKLRQDGFKFRNLGNMFGAVIQTGRPVIINQPESDHRSGGYPSGHPQIRNFLGIPIYFGERIVGEIGLANREGGFNEDILSYIDSVIRVTGQIIVARQEREARKNVEEKLEKLARMDSLTGIYNRRSFDEYLQQEWNRAARNGYSLSLMILDVDHFKLFNDHYGHQAGDACLSRIGHLMRNSFRRPADHVARYGGEEFVVVLPETQFFGVETMAEQLKESVASMKIVHAYSKYLIVTVSIGAVTVYPCPDNSSDLLLAAADECLYAAKNEGRNRIVAREIEIRQK